MARIRRNDPVRRHLHDYVLVDPFTGRDIAGFDLQDEAMRYATDYLRSQVTTLHIIHPDGCACEPGQLLYPLEHEAQAAGTAN